MYLLVLLSLLLFNSVRQREISGIDNIISDINDNEEEESAEDDVENEEDNNNNNNEGTNTSDEISDNAEGVDVFAMTSEEHDDTNKEAAASTSFEESHTATVKRRQQSRSFVMDEQDEDESSPMGGSMENDKMEGNIRISTWNPNGKNTNQVHSILQQSLDLSIDIQGYSEVNRDFLKQSQRQAFQEATTRMDRHSRAIWGTSQVIVEGDYKPGGTALITFGKTAGRVKECGRDPLDRRTYQILDGKGNKEVLIMNVYVFSGKLSSWLRQVRL
jgi:hypothetical protein